MAAGPKNQLSGLPQASFVSTNTAEGSPAAAYAASGDPLGEDPACSYQPSG
jgi:hypothetical protein